jgi:hypothetical protein
MKTTLTITVWVDEKGPLGELSSVEGDLPFEARQPMYDAMLRYIESTEFVAGVQEGIRLERSVKM